MKRTPIAACRGAWLALLAPLLGCQDLPVTLAGCAAVRVGPVCEVAANARELRVFVATSVGTPVTVLQGLRPLPLQAAEEVQGGRLLRVQVRPGARGLWVVERRGLHLRSHSLTLREHTTAPWLRDARARWDKDQVEAVGQELRARLAQGLPPDERAEALGMLGRIALEQSAIPEARARLQDALLADRETGSVSGEADDALVLAALLAQQDQQASAAEAVLGAHAWAFKQAPAFQPWATLQQAGWLRMRGALAEGLAVLDEGRRQARQLGEALALGELRLARADVLQNLGRAAEAKEELQGLAEDYRAQGAWCRAANALTKLGRLRLLGLQATPSLGAAWPTEEDPAPPLQQSLTLRRAHCQQAPRIAENLALLAATAILRGDVGAAEQALLRSQEEVAQGADIGLRRHWAMLEGHLALLRAQRAAKAAAPPLYQDAARRLRAALVLLDSEKALPSAPREHAGQPGARAVAPAPDPYDSGWRARVALAQVLAALQRPAEAETEFLRAEEHLERRGLELTRGEVRSGYLGRHQLGTGAFVEFLVDQRREADALRVVRQALARGLRGLVRLSRLSALSPEEEQRFAEAQAAYQRTREAFEQASARAAEAPLNEEANQREERRQLANSLDQQLDRALRVLGERAPEALRPIAAGEVLLVCHPLTRTWLCLLGREEAQPAPRAKTTQVVSARLPREPDAAGLGALLGEPQARAILQGARRLSVISYGQALEQLDFDSLLVAGRPLAEQVEVVYALDLPQAPRSAETPASGPRQALLITDPLGEIDPALRPALQPAPSPNQAPAEEATAPWQIQSEGFGPRVPHPTGVSGLPRQRVVELLAQADLFAYFGHGFFAADLARRHLRTGSDGGLQVADILMLPRGPRAVVLVGCSTGAAAVAVGGVSGLGIAQAFLVKGQGFVIGTTREVAAEVGKAMGEALVAAGLPALVADPVARLRAARAQVRAQHPTWVQESQAFRVLVP